MLVGSGSGVGVAISYGWALLAIGFRLVDPDKELPNVGAHVLERAVLLYRAFGAFNRPLLLLFC